MSIPEDDEQTRIIRRPRQSAHPDAPSADVAAGSETPSFEEESEMTRLVAPRKISCPSPDVIEEQGDSLDPVVGWLVVLAGPGRGNARHIGYGQNSIGRDAGERVRLDFGDASISRRKHCFLIYEGRKREYILRPGDGSNLTYLNGSLVSEPRPIRSGDWIEVGKTTLRLVTLCGPEFDWQDELASPPA